MLPYPLISNNQYELLVTFILDPSLSEENRLACLHFLFTIAKTCIDNEETIRLCSQILRVIASGKSVKLLLNPEFFALLDMIFNMYSHSTCVLLHCFCCILHIIRNTGFWSFFIMIIRSSFRPYRFD